MLYNWDWLSEAQRHVRQNTGSKTAGVDGITMRGFEERLEANLQTLQEALRAGTFEPLPVRRRTIQEVKRNGKIKHRRLGIPTIQDRIVQEAMRMALEPIYEADFSKHSYGFRPNRCTMDAVTYIGKRLVTNQHTYGWVIEGDIMTPFQVGLANIGSNGFLMRHIDRISWASTKLGKGIDTIGIFMITGQRHK